MKKTESTNEQKIFFSSPHVVKNKALLKDIGVFSYIESLDIEKSNYKNLFAGALDIVNKPTITEIIDAAVKQISDHIKPSIVVFLWKPLQNREDITIKCFKNNQLVDLNLRVSNISDFEPFFRKYPEPAAYNFFASQITCTDTVKSFNTLKPETVIPIIGPSGLYGLVLLGSDVPGAEYSKMELTFIENLMSFVSKAIQNHLHYERTLRDSKTGLYNSGFFMTRLNEEIGRLKRINTEASIIIMDVDHFKNFNDSYGHIAGDKVLETLAITIKQGVRFGDVPSRFGGEEFTVLLPETDKALAWIVSERLRVMVETMKVDWEPPLPQVTISLGVFTFDSETNISAEAIIQRADEALYLSKKEGRNRSTVWDAETFAKNKHENF